MDFLIRRPIAVIMAFLAFCIIGIVTYNALPVSLLPDIAIPQITIQAADASLSAREIENTIIAPVRKQLLQVGGLDEIKSEVRDGVGTIMMKLKFGTNTDYAYIEVNEKIDVAMNYMPHGTARPKAIKASATDIPIFYLNIAIKEDNGDLQQYLEMCSAVENFIRRRIEQLPEVAMADMTGIPTQCLNITPDESLLKSYHLTIADIENALLSNNIEAGSMRVKDGVYEYSIKVATLLRNKIDVENIYIRCADRYIQLKDVCKVEMTTKEEQGFSLSDGKRVVTLAVIKQADEDMEAMKKRIGEIVWQFEHQFPNLSFTISRNQTELLDYTISNLKQNLLIGFILIIVVTMFFMGGVRSSLVIGISMIVSVVISFIPFYIAGKSLNIISLSGLILVVGMMIDNALIVSENISQWRKRGLTMRAACVGATKEMGTPLLSSSLTTIAVFVPLVFVQGMAGAIFCDQAFAITVGLGVSYIVGIILLPVLYRQFASRKDTETSKSNKINLVSSFYDKGFDFVLRRQKIILTISLLMLPLCWLMFTIIPTTRMPEIEHNELTAHIEWGNEINVQENRLRTEKLLQVTKAMSEEQCAYVGIQDFIVESSNELSQTEAELYWRLSDPDSVKAVMEKTLIWMADNYPSSSVSFAPPTTIFEKIFDTAEPDIVAQITLHGHNYTSEELREFEKTIVGASKEGHTSILTFKNVKNIIINREALEVYHVNVDQVKKLIENTVSGSLVTTLHSYNSYMPVCISGNMQTIENLLAYGMVETTDNMGKKSEVPLRQLVRQQHAEELKTITAGNDGEYIPVCFYEVTDGEALCDDIRKAVRMHNIDVTFSGAFYGNQRMMGQLIVILLISVMLMYFILCAQFESFLQPLVVLAEIPIDTAIALVIIWLTGHTLNLMSGIGIIVSCGIIVNDSIIKIDTINELRKSGMPIIEAIHTAGRRRLRAIIMTSLTTIGAMLPILFTRDMGSEIQQPLAVAMVVTMVVGTLVSLYIIPLIYKLLSRKS